jgi:hypothetical protein
MITDADIDPTDHAARDCDSDRYFLMWVKSATPDQLRLQLDRMRAMSVAIVREMRRRGGE